MKWQSAIYIPLACAFLVGCVTRSQLTKLQQEKEQLTAYVANEKQRNAELATQLGEFQNRAAEAERELALMHDGNSGKRTGVLASAGNGTSLHKFEEWVRLREGLVYDPVRRNARLPLPVNFSSEDRIPFQGRRELDLVADWLMEPSAKNVGIRVSVSDATINQSQTTRRANAIVDYLKNRGISSNRMEITAARAWRGREEEDRPLNNGSKVEFEFFQLEQTDTLANENLGSDNWTPSSRRR